MTLKRLNLSRSITNNSKHENCSNESSLDNYEDDDEKILRVSCKQVILTNNSKQSFF